MHFPMLNSGLGTFLRMMTMCKRIFDICFSLLALVIGAPLFILCIAAVRLSSHGPAFHACTRIGRNGVPFRCWKFRTMVIDAEEKLQLLLSSNNALMQEWQTYYKLKEDPRITPVGRWLRKTSLDELPQFWNVLWGDMSIVGPRPLSKAEIEEYVKDRAPKLLSVRPGLTSIWAVSGRSEISYPERLLLEEQYVDQSSLSLDLALIGKTFLSMLFPKGAY